MKVLIDDRFVPITPRMIGRVFADLSDDHQVDFLNAVAERIAEWPGHCGFLMQLQWITDSDLLTKQARSLMRSIGEYADKEV